MKSLNDDVEYYTGFKKEVEERNEAIKDLEAHLKDQLDENSRLRTAVTCKKNLNKVNKVVPPAEEVPQSHARAVESPWVSQQELAETIVALSQAVGVINSRLDAQENLLKGQKLIILKCFRK